ncbi:MAG: aldo/keto reductase [Flavobacteriales bacterium]|nr:aldo/keto reductase [Flavobacteriales bacterium]
MNYRRLGKSGLQVSELSFGSWITFGNQIDDGTSEALMKTAYDAGINFFDNAEAYATGESERVMGKILKKFGWNRDTYILSSKVFFGIHEACHDALKRLQTDYLDLFFCHRPDKQTPIEETVWSMHNLITQGKIMYWGTSEWSAQEIMEAHMAAQRYNLIGPVMEQPQYNMLVRDKVEVEYSQIYKTVGLGTTIWSPLASGILTGKYNDGKEGETRLKRAELSWLKDRVLIEETLEKVKKLTALAKKSDISMTHMALAWCLKNPDVSTVILGASRNEQLEENLRVTDHLDKLDDELMEAIESILDNKPAHPAF